jgi:iron complex outermembrane recepter protein
VGDVMLNIPISDTLALRFNGGKIDYDGLTDYVNVYALDDNGIPVAPNGVLSTDATIVNKEDADTVEIGYGRLSLLFEPSESLRFVLAYQQQSDEVGGRRQQTLGTDGLGKPYDDYENGSIQLEPSSRDVNLTSLEAEMDLGFATLTSSSSYVDHEGESISENTGFYAQAGFLAFYYNFPRPMASAVRTYGDQAFIKKLKPRPSGVVIV